MGANKLGIVSAVSTPLQGSIESLGIQPNKSLHSRTVDDWDDKLLGYKKGCRYESVDDKLMIAMPQACMIQQPRMMACP